MTIEQRIRLIKYAEEIGIQATPLESCGVLGLSIGKLDTFSPERAHAELLSLSILTIPTTQVAA